MSGGWGGRGIRAGSQRAGGDLTHSPKLGRVRVLPSCCLGHTLLSRLWHPWAVGRSPPSSPNSDLIEQMSARAWQGQETLQHMCAKQWVCVPQRVTDVPVMRSCFSPGSPRVVLWSVSQVDLVPLGITAATMAPTQESHGWGSARPCRLTPHLLPSQEQPCLKDSASPVGAACEAPGSAVLPSTGPPQLDCPAGSPSPSIPVPGPKTPAPPASALSCVWRQKLTGRHRAPRWLPRSCLQAAPGQSGVELHFGPGRGLWGQQAVSEGGS